MEGVKDGSIDAMFWSGGLPTGGITDLFVSQREAVKFLDVTDTLPKLQELNPIYEQGVIPASTYRRRRTCRPWWCPMCFWSKTIWTETLPAC